jgi:dipeptidase E
MKLYLSSYRVPTPKDVEDLLGMPLSECRAIIVPNAKDYQPAQERAQKIAELKADLAHLGLKAYIADLRDFDSPEQLLNVVGKYDLFWVAGGNTYVLRYEMRRSGFDKILDELLQNKRVYGGESAGAIVAGPSLGGFDVADSPSLAPDAIWEGLGLTGKIIAPHMDNPDFQEYTAHIKQYYAEDDRVIYLNDNQAFVVNGEKQAIVTAPIRGEG